MIDVKKMKEELLGNPTLYCSARAHLRGKLHMSRIHGGTLFGLLDKDCWSYFGYRNKECVADERRHIFNWTMSDQEALVKDVLEKYRKADEEKAA